MTIDLPVSVPDQGDNHLLEVISDTNDHSNNSKGISNCCDIITNVSSSSSARRVIKGTIFFAAIALGCFVLLSSFSTYFPISLQPSNHQSNSKVTKEAPQLKTILQKASMKDDNKTVILTILNDAWAEPNSIFDLFVESFRIGDGTESLLSHLVVICMDDKAYARCLAIHPHCYHLGTKGVNFTNEAFFMSPSYLEMVWRKIGVLSEVLELGYSFIFSDNDIMWLRNPFQRFFKDVDFQMSCDHFNGNSYDLHNFPNTGFMYVKSNHRTNQFFKFWQFSIKAYPGLHDQDILNNIKFDHFVNDIGLTMRFLDTAFFGGFCQPSRDLNLVCTMHANCCVGLENKVNDLAILLEDWKRFQSSQPGSNPQLSWSVPQNCSTSFQRAMGQHK